MTNLLSAESVARMLDISVRTVWDWVAKGLLPQPVSLSTKAKRWKVEDIEAAIKKLERSQR